MSSRLVRSGAMAVAALVTALAATVPVAAPPASAEARAAAAPNPVLAILSPIAAPACTTAGTATLLVPIVGGLVQSQLALGKSVDIGDVILDALGPVYVVCGTLPAAPGTRCQLDDQIAGLLPSQISSVTGPAPALVGALLDVLGAALEPLGLTAADALKPALQCDIRAPGGAAQAPPGADAPVALPPVPGVDTITPPPAILPAPAGLDGVLGPTTNVEGAAPARVAPTETVVDLVRHVVPDWVHALQLLAAAVVVLFLAGSWVVSARAARGAA
jgi:hypothetical protein